MSQVLNQKMSWAGIVAGFADKFKGILAAGLSAEEKLRAITAELEKDVAAKRQLAREIGAQKRALSDPDTKTLEPLEALRARYAMLAEMGAGFISDKEGNKVKLAALQTEMKSLKVAMDANQTTFDTLEESYGIAKANYQSGLDALDRVRTQAPAILIAIKAHAEAMKTRDKARDAKSVDISFMDDLTDELAKSKATSRADKALDTDLDATNAFSINAELEKQQANEIDEAIMADFEKAARRKSKSGKKAA